MLGFVFNYLINRPISVLLSASSSGAMRLFIVSQKILQARMQKTGIKFTNLSAVIIRKGTAGLLAVAIQMGRSGCYQAQNLTQAGSPAPRLAVTLYSERKHAHYAGASGRSRSGRGSLGKMMPPR